MELKNLVNTLEEKLTGKDDDHMELRDLVHALEGRLVGNDEYFSIDGYTRIK